MQSLSIKLSYSRIAMLYGCILHAVPLILVLILPWNWITIAVVIVILLHFPWILYYKVYGLSQNAIVYLSCDNQGNWMLHRRDGRDIPVILAENCFFSGFLCVLNFRVPSYHIVIFRDSVSEMDFRRLRMYGYAGFKE